MINESNRKFIIFALIVVVIGSTISFLTYYAFLKIGNDRVVRTFQADANDRISLIMNSFENNQFALEAVRSYFTGADSVNVKQFDSHVLPLLNRMIGTGSVSWITTKNAYSQSNQYIEEYVARADSKLSQELKSVVTSPFILKYLKQASQTGAVVVTPLHVSAVSGKKGFYLLLPVHNYKKDGTVGAVKGVVCGFLIIKDVMEYTLWFLNPAKLDIELYDVGELNRPQLLFHHKGAITNNISKNVEAKSTIFEFYQRKLEAVCKPHQEYLNVRMTIVHYVILLLGFVFTIFTIAYGYLHNMERLKVNTLVKVRTHELEESERSLRRYGFIINQMFDGVIVTDLEGVIVDWNNGAHRIFGYTKEDAIGQLPSMMHQKDDVDWMTHDMLEGVRQSGRWFGEVPFIHKDGSSGVCETSVVPFYNDSNEMVATIGVNRDITKRKIAEEQLKHLAHYDTLTTLPNRNLMLDRLKVAIAGAKRRKTIVSVMFLDLDGFKEINDTCGHDSGDEVLKQVSDRLSNNIRESDTVSRYGGDEFVIILIDQANRDNSKGTADKILSTLAQPYFLASGTTVEISASVGVSFYPYDGDFPEQLIKEADAAMYKAKEAGRNTFRVTEIYGVGSVGEEFDI